MDSQRKQILAILGSTRAESANLQLINALAELAADRLAIQVYKGIGELPHFNPDVDSDKMAAPVAAFHALIRQADGVIICTPEYVFSLPGSLKNALEWTVATTLFADKPVALITASALGEKAHDELRLIMQTFSARFDADSEVLISGIRSKLNRQGQVTDGPTLARLRALLRSFETALSTV